jgi:hypothetical protein
MRNDDCGKTESRRQEAESRRQKAEGRKQKAGGRKIIIVRSNEFGVRRQKK